MRRKGIAILPSSYFKTIEEVMMTLVWIKHICIVPKQGFRISRTYLNLARKVGP